MASQTNTFTFLQSMYDYQEVEEIIVSLKRDRVLDQSGLSN